MSLKLATAILVVLTAFGALAPGARAEAPSLGANIWTPQGLSFNDCMQRATGALRQLGSNPNQQTLFQGMGYVYGPIGDYNAMVMCVIHKGTVAFVVAGQDFATANNYVSQINKIMERR